MCNLEKCVYQYRITQSTIGREITDGAKELWQELSNLFDRLFDNLSFDIALDKEELKIESVIECFTKYYDISGNITCFF